MQDSDVVAGGSQHWGLAKVCAGILGGHHENREGDYSDGFQEVAGSVVVKNLEVRAGTKKSVEQVLARLEED